DQYHRRQHGGHHGAAGPAPRARHQRRDAVARRRRVLRGNLRRRDELQQQRMELRVGVRRKLSQPHGATARLTRVGGPVGWWKDLRFGARLLVQKPAFTAVAALTLALGIGANTAIFTLFDALLLQSLPVREPGRLVLCNAAPNDGTSVGSPPVGRWRLFSYEVYEFLRKQPLPFESLAGFRSGEAPVSVRLAGEASPSAAERAQAHLVGGTYFN